MGWPRRMLAVIAALWVLLYWLYVSADWAWAELAPVLVALAVLVAVPAVMPTLGAFRIACVVVLAPVVLGGFFFLWVLGPGFLLTAVPLAVATLPLEGPRRPRAAAAVFGTLLIAGAVVIGAGR